MMRAKNNLMEAKNYSIDATHGTEQSLPDLFVNNYD